MRLFLQAAREVGGPAIAAAAMALEFVLDQVDAWDAIEERRQILADEAATDAKAALAFGHRNTSPPPAPPDPPDTLPGEDTE